jgi:hypothetical protein
VAINPFNQRNMQYGINSTKEQVRKNNLFMQNKANFQKVKLNVTKVLTKDYDQMDTWSIRKTKPIQSQLKPIQSQLKPIKANIMPKQSQFKPNLSWRSLWRSRKQTQFQRFIRLDFDYMLNYSRIWESFGNRILRRTAKCGPTAAAGGQLKRDKYFALEKALSYKRKGINHEKTDGWKRKSFRPRKTLFRPQLLSRRVQYR